MSDVNDRKERFIEKHKKTKDQIDAAIVDGQKAREKYSRDTQTVENALMTFFERLDPIIDPVTDTAMAWVRQIPVMKLMEYTPEKIRNATRELTEEEMREFLRSEENIDLSFKMMADLIAIPKKDKDWWRENAPPDFIALFEATLSEILTRTSEKIDFF